MKTEVSIPDRLFASAERARKKRQRSRSAFYAEALTVYLRRPVRRGLAERLRTVYGGSNGAASALSSDIDRAQSEALARET